jgi:hypothetical protein
MKKHLLTLAVLVFISGLVSGQLTRTGERVILFHGIIIDAGTNDPLPNSQIFINKIFASVSNNEGKFAFYVNKLDTITFRSLGYKPAVVCISDTLKGKEYIAGIFMHTDTLTVPTVVIMPRIASLKSDILRPQITNNKELDNAKYNLEVSAYQGRVIQGKLGDPAMNYEMLRQQQKADAYSKGQIPPDRILGLSPLLLIPAAYLLINGLPEKPVMVRPVITDYETDMIFNKYLESIREK